MTSTSLDASSSTPPSEEIDDDETEAGAASVPASSVPRVLGVLLAVAGIIGFIAAFELTLDKFIVASNPDAPLSCNVSILVGCSKNLLSWQGSLFGFPNPILGLAGWTATIVVGAGILSGARFARWYWLCFNLGVAGAMALVVFLIGTSIFALNILCPWCMLTWSVVIPTFWAVTLYNLKSGTIPLPRSLARTAEILYYCVPLLTAVSYVIVAIIAQVHLDWLGAL